MAATTSKDLTITFQRADGKDHKITIPDYKEGITDAEIKAGAQSIVDQGAFEPEGFDRRGSGVREAVEKGESPFLSGSLTVDTERRFHEKCAQTYFYPINSSANHCGQWCVF